MFNLGGTLYAVLYLRDDPQLVTTAGHLLPDLQHSAHLGANAHGVHALAACPRRAQTHGALRGVLHLPHLGRAAHVLPQVQPCAVGSAGHGQIQQLAGGTVADAVHTIALADKAPLLFGLVVILAQTDSAAVLAALHCLNDIAGVSGNGIKAVGLDHSLCYGFHVQIPPNHKMHRFFQFLLIKNTTYRDFSQAIRQFFSTLYRIHPVFACFFAPSQGRKAVFTPSRHFVATALYCFHQDYLPLWKGRLSRF